jgi:hypothetical protein
LEIKHLNAIDGIMRTKKGSIVSIAEGDDIVFGELGRLRPDHPQMPLKHVPLLSCRGRKLDQARRRPLGASTHKGDADFTGARNILTMTLVALGSVLSPG